MGNRYGAFLDNYNRGNEVIEMISRDFFDKTHYDVEQILHGQDDVLRNKFQQFSMVAQNSSMTAYDKIVKVASLLEDAVRQAMSSPNISNVLNIIYNLLDVVRQTEDQHLIDITMRMVAIVNGGNLL